jgi:hypothetical protein
MGFWASVQSIETGATLQILTQSVKAIGTAIGTALLLVGAPWKLN